MTRSEASAALTALATRANNSGAPLFAKRLWLASATVEAGSAQAIEDEFRKATCMAQPCVTRLFESLRAMSEEKRDILGALVETMRKEAAS
jgi:hypothetical protein